MKFSPSKYQKNIFNFITSGSGNALVDAVAGSGKSTTIVEALKVIPNDQRVLFLAFNKAIVEELGAKVSFHENVDVMTLHSLGARSVMRKTGAKIDGDKYTRRLNTTLRDVDLMEKFGLDKENQGEYRSNIRKLMDLVRVELCTDVAQFREIADKHGLFLFADEIQMVASIVRWGYINDMTIDFTDMIYFPVKKGYSMKGYDWVFIDECQDLNAAQRELFLKCVRPGGRFIAVGDPRQAIYGFAGADAFSFEILKKIPDTLTLPLSVCYRCDGSIIELASKIVPQIEAREGAPKGVVDFNASVDDVSDGDMVLCRFTAPLIGLCMSYISNGIKANVKGRDIGANLSGMVKRTGMSDVSDMLRTLEVGLNKIALQLIKNTGCTSQEARELSRYVFHLDKVNAITVLSEGLKRSQEVMSRIKEIFSDDDSTDGIMLSTIHRSKGLESKRVFILMPEKLRDSRSEKRSWMAEQETNLEYVAYTRAKNHLGFITDFEA